MPTPMYKLKYTGAQVDQLLGYALGSGPYVSRAQSSIGANGYLSLSFSAPLSSALIACRGNTGATHALFLFSSYSVGGATRVAINTIDNDGKIACAPNISKSNPNIHGLTLQNLESQAVAVSVTALIGNVPTFAVTSADAEVTPYVEWPNPPLALGSTYRTTERYQGAPVRITLVNFGALPNASAKTVNIGTGIKPIAVGGNMSTGATIATTVPNFAVEPTLYIGSSTSNGMTSVTIYATRDYSAYTALVWMKYVMTADL